MESTSISLTRGNSGSFGSSGNNSNHTPSINNLLSNDQPSHPQHHHSFNHIQLQPHHHHHQYQPIQPQPSPRSLYSSNEYSRQLPQHSPVFHHQNIHQHQQQFAHPKFLSNADQVAPNIISNNSHNYNNSKGYSFSQLNGSMTRESNHISPPYMVPNETNLTSNHPRNILNNMNNPPPFNLRSSSNSLPSLSYLVPNVHSQHPTQSSSTHQDSSSSTPLSTSPSENMLQSSSKGQMVGFSQPSPSIMIGAISHPKPMINPLSTSCPSTPMIEPRRIVSPPLTPQLPTSHPLSSLKLVSTSTTGTNGQEQKCPLNNCKMCTQGSPGILVKNPTWAIIMRVVFYSLKVNQPDKDFFNLKTEVYGFMISHWDRLCINRKRSDNWKKQIQDMLSHSKDLFESGMDHFRQNGFWKLKQDTDPWEMQKKKVLRKSNGLSSMSTSNLADLNQSNGEKRKRSNSSPSTMTIENEWDEDDDLRSSQSSLSSRKNLIQKEKDKLLFELEELKIQLKLVNQNVECASMELMNTNRAVPSIDTLRCDETLSFDEDDEQDSKNNNNNIKTESKDKKPNKNEMEQDELEIVQQMDQDEEVTTSKNPNPIITTSKSELTPTLIKSPNSTSQNSNKTQTWNNIMNEYCLLEEVFNDKIKINLTRSNGNITAQPTHNIIIPMNQHTNQLNPSTSTNNVNINNLTTSSTSNTNTNNNTMGNSVSNGSPSLSPLHLSTPALVSCQLNSSNSQNNNTTNNENNSHLSQSKMSISMVISNDD